MKLTRTKLDLSKVDFEDCKERKCSLREYAFDDGYVWLGTEDDPILLSQEMVAELLPYLQRFAEHGVIEEINQADDIPFGENDGVRQ